VPQYDLIIAGTGFASSFFLYQYLQRFPQGKRVLVLERGQSVSHRAQMQARQQDSDYFEKLALQHAGMIDNQRPEKPWIFSVMQGGGSNCWWGCVPRFMPSDFEMQTRYGVGTDWPISYADLETYYQQAEELMWVAGPEATPFPRSAPYPLPPHRLNPVDQLFQKRFGSFYIPQPAARASASNPQRGVCCNNASCSLCPANAKFTVENGFPALYQHPSVCLVHDAMVLALETQNDLVRAVRYQKEGKEELAEGELIALGTNPIFNAWILQKSADTSPHLGQGLCEQLVNTVDLYLDGLVNQGASTVVSANGYMLYDGPHRSERGAILLESHNDPNMLRPTPGKWRQVARLKCIIEDLPQAQNQVRPGRDSRFPAVHFQDYSDYAKRSLAQLEALITPLVSHLPLEEIRVDPTPNATEAHILGTHRMSREQEDGVTDAQLVHHRWRNLFVLGGGSFPTISPANPTLTLSALSLRAADLYFR
jgi:choline dehydrogenase-like flavoprotein